jgi:hypothetical protein
MKMVLLTDGKAARVDWLTRPDLPAPKKYPEGVALLLSETPDEDAEEAIKKLLTANPTSTQNMNRRWIRKAAKFCRPLDLEFGTFDKFLIFIIRLLQSTTVCWPWDDSPCFRLVPTEIVSVQNLIAGIE